jgi:hypothetical protein
MAALGELGIDPNEMDKYLLIQDWYGTAAEMVESLKLEQQADGAFKLIVIDTLASFFPGDNSNDNAQVMAFLRGVRPLTGLDGNPTVVIAAHPVKNAADDNLVPYGGGAILNEVDGNLTMVKMSSTRTMLHWQGKIRGIEFDPLQFELREITCAAVCDKNGALLKMPFLECCDPIKVAEAVRGEGDQKIRTLRDIQGHSGSTQTELCTRLGLRKGTLSKWVKEFKAKRWVTETGRGGLRITAGGGIKELEQDDKDRAPPDPDKPF